MRRVFHPACASLHECKLIPLSARVLSYVFPYRVERCADCPRRRKEREALVASVWQVSKMPTAGVQDSSQPVFLHAVSHQHAGSNGPSRARGSHRYERGAEGTPFCRKEYRCMHARSTS